MSNVQQVRSRAGSPVAADFAGGEGTPVVVNMTTGQCYVMNAAGTIVEVGASNPSISALLSLLVIGNANKAVKINGTGTAFEAV